MSEEYTIKQIVNDDVNDVLMLLIRTFFIDEPLNKAVDLCPKNEICPELEHYCWYPLCEGLSFKALDRQGNIIAVMISGVCPLKEANDGTDLLSQAQRCRNPKFQKILYILARREEGARLWEKFPQDKILVEVKVAATDPMWRRKGIMNALLGVTERATLSRGLRLLRMDTSSLYSAMSAEKNGFTCVYNAKYVDILMDGKPIIVPEPPHEEDRVYIKELRNII